MSNFIFMMQGLRIELAHEKNLYYEALKKRHFFTRKKPSLLRIKKLEALADIILQEVLSWDLILYPADF